MNNTNIKLTDIAGYQEVKDEAKKIIEVLKDYEKYKSKGAYIPKGLILSGSPGVGKTMLAKAIATESGVSFYEFESNESEKESDTIKSIKDLFKKARENAPSIIFIDELDELVFTLEFRSDYSRKTAKILLTEIDGISSSDGILVIATTNEKYSLPPALVRSGRMDKSITIDIPDIFDREEIFKLYLKKNKEFESIDCSQLAARTAGFTGADIKTLVNETLIDCTARGIDKITLDDFERNIPLVMFQDIKKYNKKEPDDITCYHEIGHFITNYKLENKIGSISTEKYGQVQGHVMVDEDETEASITKNSLMNKMVVLLGGVAGEEVMCSDRSTGSINDISRARLMIAALMSVGAFGLENLCAINNTMNCQNEIYPMSEARLQRLESIETSLLNEAINKAKELIADNKDLVRLLHKELKAKHRLSKKEIIKIMQESSGESYNE